MTTATTTFASITGTPRSSALVGFSFAPLKSGPNKGIRGTLLVHFRKGTHSTYYYANVSRAVYYGAKEITKRTGGEGVWRFLRAYVQLAQAPYMRVNSKQPVRYSAPSKAKEDTCAEWNYQRMKHIGAVTASRKTYQRTYDLVRQAAG